MSREGYIRQSKQFERGVNMEQRSMFRGNHKGRNHRVDLLEDYTVPWDSVLSPSVQGTATQHPAWTSPTYTVTSPQHLSTTLVVHIIYISQEVLRHVILVCEATMSLCVTLTRTLVGD